MEAKTNYTIVGLAVILLASGLIIAGIWLSMGFGQKKYNTYVVYIHEGVSGLNEDSPVKYNGVQVGNVGKIQLSPYDPQEVKLLLNILEGTPITTSTSATLISQGITGTTFVGLSASSSDLTPLRKLPNEPYPIIPAKPSLLNQLDRVLKEVSENVNSLSIRLKEILNPENAENLKKSLANIQTFTDTLAKQNKAINIFIKNLSEASKDMPQAVKDFKQGMNKLTIKVGEASQSITTTMHAGKTAIDKISEQTIPPALSLLRKLNVIASDLERVSAQLRQNPSVIIRGTTGPKPGPGE